jgi:hypothetical protein
MSGLQEGCKEVLRPAADCIIILALSMKKGEMVQPLRAPAIGVVEG